MMAKSGNIHCLSGGREYHFDGEWLPAHIVPMCYFPEEIGDDHVADNEVAIIPPNRAYIDGLVQERRNSSVLATGLRPSCTNPSISYSVEISGWINNYIYIKLHFIQIHIY